MSSLVPLTHIHWRFILPQGSGVPVVAIGTPAAIRAFAEQVDFSLLESLALQGLLIRLESLPLHRMSNLKELSICLGTRLSQVPESIAVLEAALGEPLFPNLRVLHIRPMVRGTNLRVRFDTEHIMRVVVVQLPRLERIMIGDLHEMRSVHRWLDSSGEWKFELRSEYAQPCRRDNVYWYIS